MLCDKKADILPDISEIINKDESVCPVDWARNCLSVSRKESCGECVMCRDGINQIYLIVSDIVSGKGASEDLELIPELCGVVEETASCEMAGQAAKMVRVSLENYIEEWNSHIKRKRCTALVCKSCYTVHILPEKCTGTGACVAACPEGAVLGGEGMIRVIDQNQCTKCGACITACQKGAVVKAGAVKPSTPESPVPVGSWSEENTGTRRRRRRQS